jgi:hypothetical protein
MDRQQLRQEKLRQFQNELEIGLPRKGDIVMFYEFGDVTNEPFPLIVASVHNGGLISGLVITNNTTRQVRDLHHARDPWCEDHSEVVRERGSWLPRN